MEKIKKLFQGRLSRSNFWKIFGLTFILTICVATLADEVRQDGLTFLSYILMVVFFVIIFFYISLFVRRMHDSGRSGKNLLWILPGLIITPIAIYFLAVLLNKGSGQANRFGKKQADDIKLLDAAFNLENKHQPIVDKAKQKLKNIAIFIIVWIVSAGLVFTLNPYADFGGFIVSLAMTILAIYIWKKIENKFLKTEGNNRTFARKEPDVESHQEDFESIFADEDLK